MTRTAFTDDDKAFIESVIYFFLATADAEGRPDCSFKGGPPGFVRVTGPTNWRFPTMTATACSRASAICRQSERRHAVHRHARQAAAPARQRHGECEPRRPADGQTVGAQMIVRVEARAIFPNCPRYIPTAADRAVDLHAQPGCDPIEPAWKGFDAFKDDIHPRQPTWKG